MRGVLKGGAERGCLKGVLKGGGATGRAGHSDSVTAAAVDGRGLRCVSGSDDGTCRVFDLASGAASHVLRLPGPPSAVVVRGEVCLVTVGERAHVFDLVGGRPAFLAFPCSHTHPHCPPCSPPAVTHISNSCKGRSVCAAHPALLHTCSRVG